jgi:GLPGLI family protein
MKIVYVTIFFFLLSMVVAKVAFAQKRAGELTLVYNYALFHGGQQPLSASPDFSATFTIYLKGTMSRSDLSSPVFFSSTIFNANTGQAIILREVSGQKLLIRLNQDDWADKNKGYDTLDFSSQPETKVIAGYHCQKAVATTQDSLSLTVYYTRELIPDNKLYDPMFRKLDGLPLEYELTNGHTTIKYTLASINMNPVPESKFDIPPTGFREMSYLESKKLHFVGP